MATIAVMGAGLGGMPAAYELKKALGKEHRVVLINPVEHFSFTPSNPWVAVGWRQPDEIRLPIERYTSKKGVDFIASAVTGIAADDNRLELENGDSIAYDYLVIATGPDLAFDEIPGLGPDGFSHSICTTEHAALAHEAYTRLLENPGPVVIGAVQGASCFGPAYEFALILDNDLRERKLRSKVPITFVTSEPYMGHLGLGGVGDSKGLMESEFRQRDIRWHTNCKVDEITADQVRISEYNLHGDDVECRELPCSFAMLLPGFRGVKPVAEVPDLTNPRGFVQVDEFQRSTAYQNIFSAGVCVAIPPVEVTPVPTGAPKTGYMIESMVAAIVENIQADIEGRPAVARATWNAICLADMGDTGVAFVALPQIPPRNTTWAKKGKWVHLAKIAFEKYFLRKMRQGDNSPVYEKYVLKTLGIKLLADD